MMHFYDARPWLVWLMCTLAGCWLVYEAYELGRRSAPMQVAFITTSRDTLALPPDSLLCAQWETILWYDSLRIVETNLP
jgi:hypothetical protein